MSKTRRIEGQDDSASRWPERPLLDAQGIANIQCRNYFKGHVGSISEFMKEKIELLTNIAFIAVVLIIGGVAVKNAAFSKKNNELEPRAGSQLPNPPGYEWNTHDLTLVLALKKNCQYCENSMPFYRTLAELRQAKQISAHIVSMFPDSIDEARDVMNREKIAVDVIGGIQWPNYKISGTPTLILVDKQGRVVKSWLGQLPKDAESEVVSALSASSK